MDTSKSEYKLDSGLNWELFHLVGKLQLNKIIHFEFHIQCEISSEEWQLKLIIIIKKKKKKEEAILTSKECMNTNNWLKATA